ncbi:Hypothetical protein FKW44_011696 [Caligus rogercresseyi]|uniref:Uncharacterized protein n=1 Tax=Caligus rogercresseyi TaxID=217165 RepID=A0A7T8HIQ2_CALRO|nr:Hypothetical protein FKW44_011696 [Caligus rogercresseyi]
MEASSDPGKKSLLKEHEIRVEFRLTPLGTQMMDAANPFYSTKPKSIVQGGHEITRRMQLLFTIFYLV